MAITSISRVRLPTIIVFFWSSLTLKLGVNFAVCRFRNFYVFFFRTIYDCSSIRGITYYSIFFLYKKGLPVFFWDHSFHNTKISCLLLNKTFLWCLMCPFCLLTEDSFIFFKKFPVRLSSGRLLKNLHLGFWSSVIIFIMFYLPRWVGFVERGVISKYEFLISF